MCRRAFAVKKPVVITESGDVVIEVMNPAHRDSSPPPPLPPPSSPPPLSPDTKCSLFMMTFLCIVFIAVTIYVVLMTLRVL